MAPPLALFLCSVFVFILLRLERKQEPSVSHYLWLPTVWFLFTSSKPLGIWFGAGGSNIESGSSLDRGFLIILLCLATLFLIIKRPSWSDFFKSNYLVIFILGYMLFSILWSDIPDISFRRWIRELIAFSMALMVFSEKNPRKALQSILKRSIYILVPFSWLLIKYYPSLGVEYGMWSGGQMWIGVSLQKNGLARLCIIFAFFLIWLLIRRKQGRDRPVDKYQTPADILLLLLTLILLAGPQRSLSYSATSTAAFAAGIISLGSFLIINKRGLIPNAKFLKILAVLIIAYGTFTPFAGKLRFFDVSSILGRDNTLTGRNEIWGIMVPLAMKRPLLGHGFGGFWTTETLSLASSHAHNGYLEVLLALGFVGLFLASFFLLTCCAKAYGTLITDRDWGILFLCFLYMTLVHNIGEPSIDTFTSPLMAMLLFFSVSSSKLIPI